MTRGRYLVSRRRLVVSQPPRDGLRPRPGIVAQIDFSGRRVAGLKRDADGAPIPYVVFEPEVVGSVFDRKMEDRTLVRLQDVPKVVIDAIVTTEDRDFFSHAGLSPKRLVGAVLQGADPRPVGPRDEHADAAAREEPLPHAGADAAAEGGRGAPRRDPRREVLARSEILEAYLNEIYLGQRGSVSVTGVEEAARFYFGKPVSELDLPEAALLAGLISLARALLAVPLPRAGSRAARARPEGDAGREEDRPGGLRGGPRRAAHARQQAGPAIEAPHFVDFVLTQVKESRSDLSRDGPLDLHDPRSRHAGRRPGGGPEGARGSREALQAAPRRKGQEPLQAAIIVLDPLTGSIRALVGGRDYQTSQFNRVVQAKRQPGSLFKPFVYLAAFERRDLVPPVTPLTILQDTPISLVFGKTEDETWSPRNYDGEFLGPVTVRQALEQSRNVPTVRLAVWDTGGGKTLLPDVIEAARKAGITSPMKPYPSLALGAFECTPMEIAAAYSVFANGGILVRPNALLGLVGPEGRRIDRTDVPLKRAADPAAVAVLDSLLQGVVNRGTGGSARRLGAQGIFAGKTGTTNDGRDAWFIGFSPRILVAVWVGFDDNRGLNLSGAAAAVPIFAEFARRLPSHYFEEPFPEVPGVVTASVDPTTGMLVTEECPTSYNEVFLAGTEPTQRCTVHGAGGPPAQRPMLPAPAPGP